MNFLVAMAGGFIGAIVGVGGIALIVSLSGRRDRRRKIARVTTHDYLDKVIRGSRQSTEVRS
jgi:hypothetical protein